MERSLGQLQEEYNKLCAQAGHLQYSIASMSKDLENINGALRKLNEEAASLANKPVDTSSGESSSGSGEVASG